MIFLVAFFTFCHLYADDTIIIQSAKTSEELRTGLIYQLDSMSTWFYKTNFLSTLVKLKLSFLVTQLRWKSVKYGACDFSG